jgi:hypothetical protein
MNLAANDDGKPKPKSAVRVRTRNRQSIWLPDIESTFEKHVAAEEKMM